MQTNRSQNCDRQTVLTEIPIADDLTTDGEVSSTTQYIEIKIQIYFTEIQKPI